MRILTGGAGLVENHMADALVPEHEEIFLDPDPQMRMGGTPDYRNKESIYPFEELRNDQVLAQGVGGDEVTSPSAGFN